MIKKRTFFDKKPKLETSNLTQILFSPNMKKFEFETPKIFKLKKENFNKNKKEKGKKNMGKWVCLYELNIEST